MWYKEDLGPVLAVIDHSLDVYREMQKEIMNLHRSLDNRL